MNCECIRTAISWVLEHSCIRYYVSRLTLEFWLPVRWKHENIDHLHSHFSSWQASNFTFHKLCCYVYRVYLLVLNACFHANIEWNWFWQFAYEFFVGSWGLSQVATIFKQFSWTAHNWQFNWDARIQSANDKEVWNQWTLWDFSMQVVQVCLSCFANVADIFCLHLVFNCCWFILVGDLTFPQPWPAWM